MSGGYPLIFILDRSLFWQEGEGAEDGDDNKYPGGFSEDKDGEPSILLWRECRGKIGGSFI